MKTTKTNKSRMNKPQKAQVYIEKLAWKARQILILPAFVMFFGGISLALTWPNPPSGEPIDGRLGVLVYPDITNDRVGIDTITPQEKFQVHSDKATGTGTISTTGTSVSGASTAFDTELSVGDEITAAGESRRVATITDLDTMTIDSAFSSDLSAESFEYSVPRFAVKQGGVVQIYGLSSCDTIDTDSSGNLSCGTDEVDDADASATNEIQGVITDQGLRVDGSDDFGLINTCTENQVLDWNNTSSIWECGDKDSSWTASGSDIYYNTGNIGIGTSSPSQLLHVDSSVGGLPASSGTTQTNATTRIRGDINTLLDVGIDSSSPFGVWFQATNFTDLSQTYPILLNPNGGNVGIGVTNPSNPLQIAAGADTDAFYFDVNGNFFVTDGNVQVTNPSGAAQAGMAVTQNNTSNPSYSASSGSASAPAYSFASDFDTGIYSSAGDQLDITTGGGRRALFFSGGIGMQNGSDTAPSYTFINDASNNSGMYLVSDDNVGFATAGNEAMTLNGGAADGTAYATITPSASLVVYSEAGTATNIDKYMDTKGTGDVIFRTATGTTERMRIDGSAGIVTITPDQDIDHDIGRSTIGTFAQDWAVFSHIDRPGAAEAGFRQNASGKSEVNAASGQSIAFRIANADKMVVDSAGDVGIGTTTPNTTLEVDGTVGFTPSATTDVTAAGGITVTKGIMRVQGSGGAVTVTATPNIVDGQDGQVVIIQGDNDTNTLTLQDESSLTGSGLQLSGGVNFTLGKGDIIQFTYDSGDDAWYEISRSDN